MPWHRQSFFRPSEYSPTSSPLYIYTLRGTNCCIPPKRITSLPTNKHLKNVQIRPVHDPTFPPSSRGTSVRVRAYLRPRPAAPRSKGPRKVPRSTRFRKGKRIISLIACFIKVFRLHLQEISRTSPRLDIY